MVTRGVPARRAARRGSVVTGAGALLAAVAGFWINKASEVTIPGWLGTASGAFTAAGVLALLTVVLAVVGWRQSDPSPRSGEDAGPGAPRTAVVAGDGSADLAYSIWPMDEFTPDLATVHAAIGRRDPQATGPSEVESLPAYVPRDHDPDLVRDVVAAAGGDLRALILLQGTSSTGKTRSLYEVVRDRCPGFQVVRPTTRPR